MVFSSSGNIVNSSDELIGVPQQKTRERIKTIFIVIFIFTTLGFLIAFAEVLVQFQFYKRPPPDWKGLPPSKSLECNFQHATVVSDAAPCAHIGNYFLLVKQGSVIDAAIATLLCNGIFNMHSMGVGGGGFINFYNRQNRTVTTFNSRETAPSQATKDMFYGKDGASLEGGLAIAVPGELYGYYEAHKRYGKLSWAELFQPAINLLKNGYPMNHQVALAVAASRNTIMKWPTLKSILWNNLTDSFKEEGDLLYNPKLAATLETVAREPLAFYNGKLARVIAREITTAGGIITASDLQSYRVKIGPAVSSTLKTRDLTMHALPPPSSGSLVIFMLNILNGYFYPQSKQALDFESVSMFYHRAVEAMKFAYGKRSLLGDQDFENVTELIRNLTSNSYAKAIKKKIDDHRTHDTSYYQSEYDLSSDDGTTHINIVGENGDAVAITTTINTRFGSFVMGEETGILYNSEMDDFSIPNTSNIYGIRSSPSNYIIPGKRPMSSMSPTIITDANGNVQYLAGASGGSRITSSTAMVLARSIFLGDTIKEAIDYPRLHHQLLPDHIFYEPNFPQEILEELEQKGHKLFTPMPRAVCQGVQRSVNNNILSNADYRKQGTCDGY